MSEIIGILAVAFLALAIAIAIACFEHFLPKEKYWDRFE